MERVGAFFASGQAVDFVLAVIGIEFVVLAARAPATARLTRTIDLLCALAPGAFILLALRAALTGAGWPWVAVFVTCSFPIHLYDLVRRRL